MSNSLAAQNDELMSNNEEIPVQHSPPGEMLSKRYKIIKTICAVLIYTCLGSVGEITGPTLPDLMNRTGSNYESISRAISMFGVGGIIGAIVGGVFAEKFSNSRDMIIACVLLAQATVNFLVPYVQIGVLYLLFTLEGSVEGSMSAVGQLMIMDLWHEKASGPLHLIQVGYGVGSFLVPKIVENFISEVISTESSNAERCYTETQGIRNSTYNDTSAFNNTNAPSPKVTGDFHYGFWIISAYVLLISAIFVGYFIHARCRNSSSVTRGNNDQPKRSLKSILHPKSCSPEQPGFALIILGLVCFWNVIAISSDRLWAKYLFSYARKVFCFSKSEAVNLQTAFWITFTVGRFIGFLGASVIPMKFMIFIEVVGILGSAIILYIFGSVRIVFWVSSCMSAFFMGPTYPTGISWGHRYINVTGVGITIIHCGSQIACLGSLWVYGYFFENFGLHLFTVFQLIQAAVLAVMPIIMQITAHRKGDRFEKPQVELPETNTGALLEMNKHD